MTVAPSTCVTSVENCPPMANRAPIRALKVSALPGARVYGIHGHV